MNATAELEQSADTPKTDEVTAEVQATSGTAPAVAHEPAPTPTARQYVHGVVWALVLGALTVALAAPHVDVALLPVLGVTGAGAGFAASLDAATRHIRNRHVAVIALATVAALVFAQVMGQDVWLRSLIAAFGAFLYMFILAVAKEDSVGGGDIKYAPLPAAGLASIGFLASLMWLWWVLGAVLIAVVGLRVRARIIDSPDDTASDTADSGAHNADGDNPESQAPAALPLGPCMAAAVLLSIPSYAWLSTFLPAGGF